MLPFCITGLWDATFLHLQTMGCYLSASPDYGMLPFCITGLWDATFLHHQTMGCYFSALPDYGMLPDSNGDHTRQGLKQKEKKNTIIKFTSATQMAVQCCFTSTEPIRIIQDREPRTSTSTFTQLLSSQQRAALTTHLSPLRITQSILWQVRQNRCGARRKSRLTCSTQSFPTMTLWTQQLTFCQVYTSLYLQRSQIYQLQTKMWTCPHPSCVHAHTRACVHTHMHAHTHTQTYTHMQARTHTAILVSIQWSS